MLKSRLLKQKDFLKNKDPKGRFKQMNLSTVMGLTVDLKYALYYGEQIFISIGGCIYKISGSN